MRLFLFISLLFLFPNVLLAQNTQKVVQVIDGSHLVLGSGETVSLLGVEAPSFPKAKIEKDGKIKEPNSATEAWAQRSKAFVEGIILNREVWLEYDQVRQNSDGQTLAYVFFKLNEMKDTGGGGEKVLLTSGTYMLNRLILQYGYATSGSSYPFKYRAEFNQLESQARQQQAGLWQQDF
jgi:endonuclease YncB( thermonuclease family)